jgi:hypothetical protein
VGSNPTSAFTTNSQLGITLGLWINPGPPYVSAGLNETFYVSLTNDLTTPSNVSYIGFPALPHGLNFTLAQSLVYVLPLLPACGFPSSTSYEPAFIVVYNPSGSPVQLNDSPPSELPCISGPGQLYHPFNASQTISQAISIGGYWTSTDASEPWVNATYHQSSPGNYTVVAFDPWGQTAELNFTVTLSKSYIYLDTDCIASAGGYTACWGTGSPYVFNCASSAATSEGCTQKVTSTLAPFPSYTINIRYPFTNATTPSWANCLWTVPGASPGQGYAYCVSLNSTSFVIGIQAPPHL